MTNLVATIVLTLSTNWTGVTSGTNELGYVMTNHAAALQYDGKEYTLPLKSDPGSVAVWRPWVPPNSITNISVLPGWRGSKTIWTTNENHYTLEHLPLK